MTGEQPDPRTEREGICRVTRTGVTGIEWVCVREVHDSITDQHRGTLANPHRHDGMAARAERHYFVNRWPNRVPAPA